MLAAIVFTLAAYLILVNLGYAPLWHDEAPLAVTGRNILLTGGYNGWDGRNLFMALNGTSVNSNLKLVSYPPWQAIPSALGIAVFGSNELGVRFFHSVLGVLSLPLFWLLLKLDFSPRLRLLAFALFALSTQTILFMRVGRYAADSVFFALLMLYAYRLYIGDRGKIWHLALASAAAVLGFFNHFAVAASFALALMAWHVLYYGRQTSRRQWLEISAAGSLSGAVCLSYLVAAGIVFSDEKLEFVNTAYQWSWGKRHTYLIFFNFRELIGLGWLPLWVALWLIYFAAAHIRKKIDAAKSGRKKRRNAPVVDRSIAESEAVIRWGVLLVLFLFFSGLLAVRPVAVHPFADSRYIVPALALCAPLTAAFVDWCWRRWGKICALPVLLTLLLSNALSFPYINPHFFSGEKLRLTLPSLIGEVHRPYRTYTSDIVDYLSIHARQDDTIFAAPWQDFAVLHFYLSDRLIFCCALDDESGVSREQARALGVPLHQGDAQPVWYVSVNRGAPAPRDYELAYASQRLGYPTQRPELEFHLFVPPSVSGGVRIYKRRM